MPLAGDVRTPKPHLEMPKSDFSDFLIFLLLQITNYAFNLNLFDGLL